MKIGNYGAVEYIRSFLVATLPEPLTPADHHLQLFDNYIENTAIRLRSIRVPATKEWTWLIEKNRVDDSGKREVSRIELNEMEFDFFKQFKGAEIRKNRYAIKLNDVMAEIDIYLGQLWGLNIATVFFETVDEQSAFNPPEIAVAEITGSKFYLGENLVGKTFADVQKEFAK